MKLRRILALSGIILLLALYGSTMVFALMDSPLAKGLLMGAVFSTVAVPVLLYAILLVARNVRGRGVDPVWDPADAEKENDIENPLNGQAEDQVPAKSDGAEGDPAVQAEQTEEDR